MSSLRNQVVLITGAGSGLGRQLALELVREGARIAAVDLHAESLQTLVAELGDDCAAWATADVTDRPSLSAAVEALEAQLGPVDVLVANAGIGLQISATDFHAEALEQQVNVNLIGVANTVAAVLPGMLQRGHGQVVAISSLASYRGVLFGAGYCASKAGVNALMESLRLELHPLGIRCTTVCPGWIRTPLAKQFSLPKDGSMDVDRAARRVLRAIRGRRSFAAFPFFPRLVMALLRCLPSALVDGPIRTYMTRNLRKRQAAEAKAKARDAVAA